MKHIKKFNEELKPEVYRRAGRILTRMNKVSRGAPLVDYGDEKEFGFYNIHFANSSTLIGSSLQFTNPKVNFYFQPFNVTGRDSVVEIKNLDEESLVQSWLKGDINLAVTFQFSFQASQSVKNKINNSSLNTWGSCPIFAIQLNMCDFDEGLDEWNTNQETGEIFPEDERLDMYHYFDNTSIAELSLKRPTGHFFGIFSDRKSALKFKKELPNLIEPHMEKVMDVLSIVGGDSADIERVKKSFNKIRVNSLYEDEKLINTSGLSNRWFTHLE